MKRLNVGVAGAGPAGLAAALALSRSGHSVRLFDQFDAPRPLGSGLILQPTGLSVLDWLGLGERMRTLGARIDRLHGKQGNRIVLDVRYDVLGSLRGCAVHRAGLFHVLHEAVVAAGISLKTSSKIKSLDKDSVVLVSGEKVGPFDLIVDALGSRSPLISHASGPDYRRTLNYGAIWASLPWPGMPFDPHALEQRYDAASVMCGVLPIGLCHEHDTAQTAFFWSLKTNDYPGWKADGLEKWKSQVLRLWPETETLLASITIEDQMTMASYDHHTLSLPYGDRLVFVGDSAHSTSPQLGQGANMALLDVKALAIALEEHDRLADALSSYARMRRFHVKLYQALSLTFTPFYQSDSRLLPMIRDYLIADVSRAAPFQKLLAAIVAGSFGRT